MKIGLIDPALYRVGGAPSPNLGDQVISRAVRRELYSMFGDSAEIIAVPSHQYASRQALKALQATEHVFVGGSNLLTFRWWRPTSWKIGPLGLAYFRNLILMGPGWGAYWVPPTSYAAWVCKRVLSRTLVHSVRDSFTRDMLRDGHGLANVANTSCPTMWCLNELRISDIPGRKAPECIFALTDYDRDIATDGALVKQLTRSYGPGLMLWPQGTGDVEYCRSLGYSGRVIKRDLQSLLQLLASGGAFDYVGTRLHAGILCLEHGVRSLIIMIDNRAKEIAADTNLPTVMRGDEAGIAEWINGEHATRIRLPYEAIDAWKGQFAGRR